MEKVVRISGVVMQKVLGRLEAIFSEIVVSRPRFIRHFTNVEVLLHSNRNAVKRC